MEKIILLLLSVDSINLRSNDSIVVFGCDDCEQKFPNIETEVLFHEKFRLSFQIDEFRTFSCHYDYNIEIYDVSVSYLPVQPDNISRDSFSYSGTLNITEADIKTLDTPLVDWKRIIQRIKLINRDSIYSYLKQYVVDYMKYNAHVIKKQLDN